MIRTIDFLPIKFNTIKQLNNVMRKYLLLSAVLVAAVVYLSGCSQAQGTQAAMPPQSLPVLPIQNSEATTYLEYSAAIEGKTNVEIRPQVSGYLDKIYV